VTTANNKQGAKPYEEKKALDQLVAWRSADKDCIAKKDDPQLRTKEYVARGKLRNAADEFSAKTGGAA
jgi:hypothetical protein